MSDNGILHIANRLPKKHAMAYLTGSLFDVPTPYTTYKNMSWEEIMLIKGVADSVAETLQACIMLGVKDIPETIQRHYLGVFPSYIPELFTKYAFAIGYMPSQALLDYIENGMDSELTIHLMKILHDPEYSRFMLTGINDHEVTDLAKNVGFVAYSQFMNMVKNDNQKGSRAWAELVIKAAKLKIESKKSDLIDQLESLKVKWAVKTDVGSDIKQAPVDTIRPDPNTDAMPE